jgi:flagellar biosynthesis protein FlhF
VLLCVPASIRAVDAARVARLYGVLSPTSLVSTKLDETEAPAGLVHAAWAARLPYSVLCFGQRVPEDVGPATAATLLEYLTPRGRGKAVAA